MRRPEREETRSELTPEDFYLSASITAIHHGLTSLNLPVRVHHPVPGPMEDATPVRVRGKKRNRDLVQAHQANITEASAKRARTLANSLSSLKTQYQAATPTLQGMPTEILEMIFLASMNVALPRALPDIGRKLSSRYVTMEYAMRTFYYAQHPISPEEMVDPPPGPQSEALACRFFTFSFFCDYWQRAVETDFQIHDWTDLEGPNRVHHGPQVLKEMKVGFLQQALYLGFAKDVLIPEKLLHGPWTEDKAKLLYALTCIEGKVDLVHTMAGETMKEGLFEAVADGNERAVACLAALLGVHRRLTTQMLRYAVIECGCRFNIVRHLLFNAQILYDTTARDQLDLHDPVLWQWADDRGEGNSGLLKDLLKDAEACRLKFEMDEHEVHIPYCGFPSFFADSNIDLESKRRVYENYGRPVHLKLSYD